MASATLCHKHEIVLPVSPERVFALLHTPSAIRAWWGAARAVVIAKPGGTWAAAWGENEDDPDYVAAAILSVFDPPRRLVLADQRYQSKSGPLPFEARFTTEFTVAPHPDGAVLSVTQDGFPADPVADEFYAACERGWRETFENIRRYVTQVN